tara:strand:+ start:22 stop:942 length:921 start_codon:yes stop_codon:yes gene_type:complete
VIAKSLWMNEVIYFSMKLLKIKIKDEVFNVWYFKGPKNSSVIHWSHGNGLHAPAYINLLGQLSNFCTVYAWDARAHGTNRNLTHPVAEKIFEQYTDDLVNLITVLYHKYKKPIILAGHSFGASICIKAEANLRGKISKLILADPVFFTPFIARFSKTLRLLKFQKPKTIYLAQNAAKRVNIWTTRMEAELKLSQKRLFKGWDKISFQKYIEYGIFETDQGATLCCPRDIEALIFKESEFEFLSSKIIDLSVKTFIYTASKASPTFAQKFLKKAKKVETCKVIPSTNHMFPIEQYGRFIQEIREHIA